MLINFSCRVISIKRIFRKHFSRNLIDGKVPNGILILRYTQEKYLQDRPLYFIYE